MKVQTVHAPSSENRPGQTARLCPFLRFNGIGAQSCFECHNSIGVYKPRGENGMTRKPGAVGGAGGFESTLFQNPFWPSPAGSEEQPVDIVRSPPSVFGTGYLQRLATEMTFELHAIRAETVEDATIAFPAGATNPLIAKGVSFGTLTITCEDAACDSFQQTGVQGVQDDLIVRPLQHKAVASTVRHFVMSALDFHMSMQPVELVGEMDCDKDSLINEMAVDLTPQGGEEATQQSLGNTTALTAFTAMVRPPQFQPTSRRARKGNRLFKKIGCADCHVPSLRIENPLLAIQDPPLDDRACPTEAGLGSNTVLDPTQHPVLVENQAEVDNNGCPVGFYCINLSKPGRKLPSMFYPRLRSNRGGSIDVPLFSDLRRHKMGENLAQLTPPQNDDSGNPIPNNEYLTSKIWGVADTGPYLHDGRARTLREAIEMHAGVGSEANDVISNYDNLNENQRASLIVFLESLRLPADPPPHRSRLHRSRRQE